MDFSRVLFFYKLQGGYQSDKIVREKFIIQEDPIKKFLTFWLQQGAFHTGSSISLNLQLFQMWIRSEYCPSNDNNRFLETDRFRRCGR